MLGGGGAEIRLWQRNALFNRGYYIRPPGNFHSEFGDRRNVKLTVRSDFWA
ncbi:hypothetical protein GNZ12_10475 [Paraburkholderia sp. 1N]|uniref:Porin n=1 Tax=Paraburkholderia solitsugae TaxID=2675748 RepID=A0ABX2BPH6_9BURK|nr:hypothetical protein [Paraburkholderia solitsugae]